jgi:MoaA/NifB/PqqE/SkfB family radical SAM enzyme
MSQETDRKLTEENIDFFNLFPESSSHFEQTMSYWFARQLKSPPNKQLLDLKNLINNQISQEEHPAEFQAPLGCQLELTYKCNLRCVHCYNRSGKNKSHDELDIQTWKNLAEQLGKAQIFQCIISGGEPLLLGQKLFDIMDILHEHGISFIFITNGFLMDEATVEKLSAYRFSWIQISIDGFFPSIHDQIRGVPGSWEKAIRAATLVRKAGLPLGIAHVLMRPNYKYIGEFIDLAYALGATRFMGEYYLPSGRAIQNSPHLVLSEQEFTESFSILENRQERYNNLMAIKATVDPAFYFRVRQIEPSSVLLIRPNGNVKLDCILPFVIGNIREEPLQKIWDRIGKKAWQHPVITNYISSVKWGKMLLEASPRPYYDDDLMLTEFGVTEPPLKEKWDLHDASISFKDTPSPSYDPWSHIFSMLHELRPQRLPIVQKREEEKFLLLLPQNPNCSLIVLNEVARSIYELCNGSRTINHLLELLLQQFEVNQEILRKDLLICLRDLEQKGLISIGEKSGICSL